MEIFTKIWSYKVKVSNLLILFLWEKNDVFIKYLKYI